MSLFKFNWNIICLLFVVLICIPQSKNVYHPLPLLHYKNNFSYLLTNFILYQSQIYVIGDFNLPSLDWSLYSLSLTCKLSNRFLFCHYDITLKC